MASYPTAIWEHNDLLLYIYLQPNAAEDKVVGLFQNAIKIQITAPAVENKANKHLIAWLAKVCKVPKQNVTIKSGLQNRYKLIRIESPKQIPIWLIEWLPKESI
jgi:uncharacterized protein (TIGR00251 family)